ncbi:hypothetical protein FB451DRAFT_1190358 [Mycena latifolia]|nr:hypothetical protein FB451DRAFT_1190358 [Mycena latifolia]
MCQSILHSTWIEWREHVHRTARFMCRSTKGDPLPSRLRVAFRIRRRRLRARVITTPFAGGVEKTRSERQTPGESREETDVRISATAIWRTSSSGASSLHIGESAESDAEPNSPNHSLALAVDACLSLAPYALAFAYAYAQRSPLCADMQRSGSSGRRREEEREPAGDEDSHARASSSMTGGRRLVRGVSAPSCPGVSESGGEEDVGGEAEWTHPPGRPRSCPGARSASACPPGAPAVWLRSISASRGGGDARGQQSGTGRGDKASGLIRYLFKSMPICDSRDDKRDGRPASAGRRHEQHGDSRAFGARGGAYNGGGKRRRITEEANESESLAGLRDQPDRPRPGFAGITIRSKCRDYADFEQRKKSEHEQATPVCLTRDGVADGEREETPAGGGGQDSRARAAAVPIASAAGAEGESAKAKRQVIVFSWSDCHCILVSPLIPPPVLRVSAQLRQNAQYSTENTKATCPRSRLLYVPSAGRFLELKSFLVISWLSEPA